VSQSATAQLESQIHLVTRPAWKVLLIEDNPVDVSLIVYALKKDQDWRTMLTAVNDPDKAIGSLTEGLAKGTKPDFVILDLNLPKQDGADVLAWMRHTPGLQDIPVVILSSSPVDLMQKRFDEAGVSADGYFTKPMQIEEFIRVLKDIRVCLQAVVKAPPSPRNDHLSLN
jgi:CheY-like chemotaxis protein